MEKQLRQHENRTQRLKRIRRIKNSVIFLMGLLLGGGSLYATYYFYYHPIMIAKTEERLTEKDREITKLNNQIQLFQKDLADEQGEKFAFLPRNLKNNGNFQELSSELDRKIKESGFVGSVLVIKDNQIVLDQGYGFGDKKSGLLNNSDTKYMLASIQKALTATLVMRLVEEKLLSLDTKLATFYPQIPGSKEITIKKMLNMTSGLALKGQADKASKEQDVIDYAVANATYSKMDKWRYSTVNYTLLTGIIRELTGRSYQDYLTSEIITPLNLRDTGVGPSFYQEPNHAISYSDKGAVYEKPIMISNAEFLADTGTGNVYLSTRDLLTFFQALIDGKLISTENLASLWSRPKESFDYTYAAGIYHQADGIYGHGRFRGFEPTMYLSTDGSTGVIVLSNYFAKQEVNTNLTKDIYQQLIKKENTPN